MLLRGATVGLRLTLGPSMRVKALVPAQVRMPAAIATWLLLATSHRRPTLVLRVVRARQEGRMQIVRGGPHLAMLPDRRGDPKRRGLHPHRKSSLPYGRKTHPGNRFRMQGVTVKRTPTPASRTSFSASWPPSSRLLRTLPASYSLLGGTWCAQAGRRP